MVQKYIRIVAGHYRRTPIAVPDLPGLRPTPDRVRETLFNWIHHLWDGQFSDKRVLDLFAGSGALGFEAASRGAEFVLLVEQHRTALAGLKALQSKLALEKQVRIHAGDAMQVLERLDSPRFDLVLLDPPFNQDWLARIWPRLAACVKPDALVYVEAEQAFTPPGPGFELLRQDRAGAVFYHLFRFDAVAICCNAENIE